MATADHATEAAEGEKTNHILAIYEHISGLFDVFSVRAKQVTEMVITAWVAVCRSEASTFSERHPLLQGSLTGLHQEVHWLLPPGTAS